MSRMRAFHRDEPANVAMAIRTDKPNKFRIRKENLNKHRNCECFGRSSIQSRYSASSPQATPNVFVSRKARTKTEALTPHEFRFSLSSLLDWHAHHESELMLGLGTTGHCRHENTRPHGAATLEPQSASGHSVPIWSRQIGKPGFQAKKLASLFRITQMNHTVTNYRVGCYKYF
jgi:hypothetical protein